MRGEMGEDRGGDRAGVVRHGEALMRRNGGVTAALPRH